VGSNPIRTSGRLSLFVEPATVSATADLDLFARSRLPLLRFLGITDLDAATPGETEFALNGQTSFLGSRFQIALVRVALHWWLVA
jgi:hypothetical protein